jgi:hypothetical protein
MQSSHRYGDGTLAQDALLAFAADDHRTSEVFAKVLMLARDPGPQHPWLDAGFG